MENLPNLAEYNDNTSGTLRFFTPNDIFDIELVAKKN